VHHSDLDLDATTGVRFHPLEIFLSLLIKTAAAALFGVHFLAVTLFEILLNAASLFNHANAAVPFDALLRRALVTPDMHRVHHSLDAGERESNFGFGFPWWDRLFGTYRDQPRGGHAALALGLPDARDPRALDFYALLSRPFRDRS
jgi:sterol desaturase/sphingolipid hydroxylase (fatty acid hydroxylase superfamily)